VATGANAAQIGFVKVGVFVTTVLLDVFVRLDNVVNVSSDLGTALAIHDTFAEATTTHHHAIPSVDAPQFPVAEMAIWVRVFACLVRCSIVTLVLIAKPVSSRGPSETATVLARSWWSNWHSVPFLPEQPKQPTATGPYVCM